jgi:hypothetical protein
LSGFLFHTFFTKIVIRFADMMYNVGVMKKIAQLIVGLCLLAGASPVFGATAYNWLSSQQYPTGLVRSYEGDGTLYAWTYDQACAVIAFAASSDTVRAKNILNKMAALQNTEGSWDDGYYADTGSPISTWRLCGNSIWMVLAINYYTQKTGDNTFVPAATKCMDWVLQMQDMNTASDKYGSISGGLTDAGALITWTSTEHNYDAYSALKNLGTITNKQNYKNRAQLVYNWLIGKMWDNTAGRFYTGYNDTSQYLDPQSWSVVNLGLTGPSGQDFKRSISWAHSIMNITRPYNGQSINGFDYDGTIGGVWFEGTEQMSLAYETIGDAANSSYYHSQTAKAQSANGGIICAVGDGGVAWPTNYQYNSVAATSWFVFCSQRPKVNPFKLPAASTGTITLPTISNVAATNITLTGARISWNTSVNTNSQVEYGVTAAYGSATPVDAPLVTAHAETIAGLTGSTLYHYRVKSKDASGNLAVSADYTFSTATDTTTLVISNVAASSVTATTALICWNTNIAGDSQVEYGVTPYYGTTTPLAPAKLQSHACPLIALSTGTLYHYRVKSTAASGIQTVSGDYTLTTPASNPAGGPKIYGVTGVVFSLGSCPGNYGSLTADDNDFMAINAIQSGSSFYTDWYAKIVIAEAPSQVSSIGISFNGHYTATQPQALYLYNFNSSTWTMISNDTIGTVEQFVTALSTAAARYVSSTGEIRARIYTAGAGNYACYADYLKFGITISSADTIAPVISGVTASNILITTTTISWSTNEAATTQVEYGATTSYGSLSAFTPGLVQSHSVTLTGLTGSTAYHYRVRSQDAAGNLAVSGDNTFTTGSAAAVRTDYYPDSVTIINGSGSGNFSDLKTNNGVYMKVSAASSGAQYCANWEVHTKISDDPGTVVNFTVYYDGHYSGQRQQELFLYNFVTNAWARIDYRAVGTSDTGITFVTSDIASYISPAGDIRLRCNTLSNWSYTCYADYVKFRVQLKNGFGGGAPAISDDSSFSQFAVEMPGTGDCKLYNNLFNPARSEHMRIDFTVGSEGSYAIRIYTLIGELVKTLIDETRAAGSYTEVWDGKNDSGETAASGVYLVHVEGPGISVTRKAVILK